MVKVFYTNPDGTPNPNGKGHRCGLDFNNGVAYADNGLTDAQRFHFKRWGFKIEGDTVESKTSKSSKKSSGTDTGEVQS